MPATERVIVNSADGTREILYLPGRPKRLISDLRGEDESGYVLIRADDRDCYILETYSKGKCSRRTLMDFNEVIRWVMEHDPREGVLESLFGGPVPSPYTLK